MHPKNTPVEITCEHCGTSFVVRYKDRHRRFCSMQCRNGYISKRRYAGRSEERTCPQCGTVFRVAVSQQQTCCSWKCRNKALERHQVEASDIERFWSKVERRGPDECWQWLGAHTRLGYGKIQWPGHKSPYTATRVSFEIVHGRPPVGMVRHRCDNPRCVNPRHLIEGDQFDNMGDAAQRDRTAFGTRNGQARLNDHDVLTIRSRYIPRHPVHGGAALAREYGVSQTAISLIIRGKNWRRMI